MLQCLYTTFSSQKYWDIPFSFLWCFSSEKVQVLHMYVFSEYDLQITGGRDEAQGGEGEREIENLFKHKY